MTLRELIKYGETTLQEAGIEDYVSDTRLLAMYAFNLDYTGLMMNMQEEMPDEDAEYYKGYIDIRSTHLPCHHITGCQEFMGYEFKVDENVLIPRQETELLVEEALKCADGINPCKALDVCCGSGCIGISFALKRKEAGYHNDKVMMLDISKQAINLAKENILKLEADCEIIKSDLFEHVEEKYDIIISNPPYIRTAEIEGLMEEVRCHEPRLALDGGEDGLYFYDRIIKEARKFLYEDGMLLFEIGYDQYEDVRRLLVDAGYSDVRLIKDYAGLDRVVTAVKAK